MSVENSNYSTEMVQELVSMYEELGNEGIEEIAQHFEKTVRSIRSKLVREGVYIASPKQSKRANGPSKKEILRDLEAVGFNTEGFDGATKEALLRLFQVISN